MIRQLVERVRYRLRPGGAFHGVFDEFEDAARSLPGHLRFGYDVPETATYYAEALDQVRHDDYPALFWLQRILAADGHARSRIVEVGGHVGLAYYGFEKLIRYPEDLEWVIVDVPSVAAEGRRLAEARRRRNLSFAHDLAEVSRSCDVLFAAGSLQYLPPPRFPTRVRSMAPWPAHILINNTPVTEGGTFVTLQNIGVSWCAYRVYSRRDLIEPLVEMGYELVDEWRKERRVEVPGHRQRTVDHYSGFYLRRRVTD
jgi:putative methyltransferase (TIGR04325 family)